MGRLELEIMFEKRIVISDSFSNSYKFARNIDFTNYKDFKLKTLEKYKKLLT